MTENKQTQAEDFEETKEEHAVRLRRISEEIKADITAGRYKGGVLKPHIKAETLATEESKLKSLQLEDWQMVLRDVLLHGSGILRTEGTISGRMTHKFIPRHEFYAHAHRMVGKTHSPFIGFDFASIEKRVSTPDHSIWLDEYSDYAEPSTDPKSTHWTQPIPTKGVETPPSDAKRAKLRAKRKKKR